MRRRDFVALIGSSAAAWPLSALAQDRGKLATVAYLGGAEATEGKWFVAFVERFAELGWVEGRTVANRTSMVGRGALNALQRLLRS